MSNIADITSLSDLLNTSPSEVVERLPRLDLSEAFRSKTDDNIEDSGDEVDKLLQQQSEKSVLNAERDDLLKHRANLQENIQELNLKIRRIKQKLLQQQTQQKLQNLLDMSSQQFVEKQQAKNPTSSKEPRFEVDDEENILQNLNVLPSKNWSERLVFIKKFCPYLEIDKIHMSQAFNQNDKLRRILEYCVISPLLFRVMVVITISSPNDSISEIQIDYSQLLLLSSSFIKVLTTNYIPQRKIPLIMFGLNSLSILLHKRVTMFHKLIRLYKKYIVTKKFDELTQIEESIDNLKLFSLLKLEDCLTFNIPVENRNISLTLNWEIALVDTITGQCESQLKLFVFDGEQLLDANKLFLDLVDMHGIVNAITIILKTSFNVTT